MSDSAGSLPKGEVPVDRTTSWSARIFLAATVVVALSFFMVGRAEPFDDSHCGQMSGWYGYSQRAFAIHGFLKLRCAPSGLFFAAAPAQVPYLNHPFWPHLWVALFFRHLGENEAALRWSILPVLLLGALSLYAAVKPAAGSVAAALSTAIFLALPIMIHNGALVDAFSFSTAAIAAVVATYLSWSARENRRSYLLFCAAVLFAGLSDWVGFFIGPVLAADIVVKRRSIRLSVVPVLWAALPFFAALLLDLLWLAWAAGSVGEGWSILRSLTRASTGQGAEVLAKASIDRDANLRLHATTGFGWGGIGLALLGLLSAATARVRGQFRPMDRCALLLFFAGGVPLVLFVDRTAEIAFWMMLAAPGIAVLCVSGISALVAVLRRFAVFGEKTLKFLPTVGAIVLVAVSLRSGAVQREFWASDHNLERGRALAELARDDDVVFFAGDFGAGRFYMPAASMPDVSSSAKFDAAVAAIRRYRPDIEKFYWGCPTNEAQAHIAWMIDYVPAKNRSRPTPEIRWPLTAGDKLGHAYFTLIDIANLPVR